jgi:hypothetical protein
MRDCILGLRIAYVEDVMIIPEIKTSNFHISIFMLNELTRLAKFK